MPKSVYQLRRSSRQYWNQRSFSAGGMKNSISACSNSRVRKTKFPGVISLRNDFPICAIPNGGFRREESSTFLKLRKIPCAVSGRRDATDPEVSTSPTLVLNIRLNARASVSSPPHSPGRLLGRSGHEASPSLSARKRPLHFLQSTIGSENPPTWPDVSQTFGFWMIAESSPTMSSREVTIRFHQASLTRRLSSTPSGP